MVNMNESNAQQITISLVMELIAQQFPEWSHLPIRPVELSGVDNRTFRLGQEMSIRLPSDAKYAQQVQKEQKWLPILARHLSVSIPEPLVMGQPSKKYPWHWSVYTWIEGESVNTLLLDHAHVQLIAIQLAQFLHELHKIDATDGPDAGPHNFYRGGSLMVYDTQTRNSITQLQDLIDVDAVTAVWEKAINSKWMQKPVWVHGDLSAGNILVKDNRLAAVIDFGCMGIGDPACDLVIAWTFLTKESREIFRANLKLNSDTWARARGWALWKSLITWAGLHDKNGFEAKHQQQIIHEIIHEHA